MIPTVLSLLLFQTRIAPEQLRDQPGQTGTRIALDQAFRLCRGGQIAADQGFDIWFKRSGQAERSAGYFILGSLRGDGRIHPSVPDGRCYYQKSRVGVQTFVLDGATTSFQLPELPQGAVPWLVQQQDALTPQSTPATPAPVSGTAAFLDTSTVGTWKGTYGADGYDIIGDAASYPAYVAVAPSGNNTFVWAPSTSDARAMQKAAATDRIAACWYSSASMSVDLQFSDSNLHQVAFYLLDWDQYGGGRSERIDVLDANSNVLDSRTVSLFSTGQYLVWNLSGHVIVRITNMNASSNAVVSGLLFGPPGAAPPPQYGAMHTLQRDTDWTIAGSTLTLKRPFSAGDLLMVEWDR